MGVYMPTVDMPANCTECKLRLIVGCNPYKDNGLSPSRERRKDCPLVEIKTPHGRLIDANERVDVTVYDDEFEEYSDITVSVDEALLRWGTDCPKTIIEAESDDDCRTCKNYNTEKCNMCGIEADYYEAEVE